MSLAGPTHRQPVDLDNPQAVAAELRRRGLPVHRAVDVIGTDERLREIFTAARAGGWDGASPPRPRYINRGRLSLAGPTHNARRTK